MYISISDLLVGDFFIEDPTFIDKSGIASSCKKMRQCTGLKQHFLRYFFPSLLDPWSEDLQPYEDYKMFRAFDIHTNQILRTSKNPYVIISFSCDLIKMKKKKYIVNMALLQI